MKQATITAITKFNIKPTLTISPILILPDENTIALGGVATGSINAMDADMVAGIIKRSGLKPNARAVPFIIGRRTVVVAVFDANSVKKVYSKQVFYHRKW